MHYALLLCLLVPTSITVAMEIVRSSSKESLIFIKKIYSLFINNQHNAAEKEIKSNDNETMTLSLLKHGIKQNNANFIQWLLVTKQLPSNDLALQKALEYSRNYKNEATNVLSEQVQLRQDLDMYIEKEIEKIAQAKKSLNITNNQNQYAITSGLILQRDGTSAPVEKEIPWEEKFKNAKPIFEPSIDDTEKCKCIIL